MKFLHTGDLHIGKTLCDFSLLEDQCHMLNCLAQIAVQEQVQALVIAGDVYDRAIPSAEAVVLLDRFLTRMVEEKIPVLMISGNHDSPERVGFAAEILEKNGLYVAGMVSGEGEGIKTVTLADEYGEVNFTLLPFVKPSVAFARSSGEAVEKLLQSQNLDLAARNVLVTHFFVTHNGSEPELSDAETTIHVGGLDNVEAKLFDGYDYVALGHIHREQKIGDKPVFYAGAPLSYSFSEAGQQKSVNIVELGEKGELSVKSSCIQPLRKLRKLRGSLEALLHTSDEIQTETRTYTETGIQTETKAYAETGMQAEAGIHRESREDYLQITLTNEEELIDPIGTLRTVYPNVMQLLLAKNEVREGSGSMSRLRERQKQIPELFGEFYEMIRGEAPDEERRRMIEQIARQAVDGS